MSIFEKDAALLDRYLNKKLDDSEKVAVEERLLNDPAFAELLEDIKLVKVAVRRKVLKDNFQHLRQLESTLPEINIDEERPVATKTTSKLRSLRQKLTVAAGILFLVFGSGLFLFNEGRVNEQLFHKNFKVYPSMENERGIANTGTRLQKENIETKESKIARAYVYYNAEYWSEAIPALQNLIKEYNRPMDQYYLGISQLANKDATNAINTFQKVLELNSEYGSRAEWYLALAFLSNNQREEAVTYLKAIVKNEESPKSYKENAARLLEDLK